MNYGRVEDFDQLVNKLNVNVSGKIAIMRYGKNYRGDKVSVHLVLVNYVMSRNDNVTLLYVRAFPMNSWFSCDVIENILASH